MFQTLHVRRYSNFQIAGMRRAYSTYNISLSIKHASRYAHLLDLLGIDYTLGKRTPRPLFQHSLNK
jgi:hypothetical protein